LRDQGVGAGEHREGIFLADAVEGRDRFQHGVTPRQWLRDLDFARSSPDRGRKIKLDITDCNARPVRRILAAKLLGGGTVMGIRTANREYKRWLERELHDDIVEADLDKKRENKCTF
jgi:hypothetical protein